MIAGFDVSGNSGDVSFASARVAGMRFCYARVGRGVPSSGTDNYGLDVRWQLYRDSARDAGMLVGGYWRFYPDWDLGLQVARFTDRLDQMPGMLPPLLDIEDTGGLAPGPLTDWTIRCADLIHDRTGRTPTLYTGRSFLREHLQGWRLDRWERCLADWSSAAWPDHSAVFWQHAGDVSVPWAAGRVDLQRFAARPADLAAHTYENDLRYWVDDDGQLYGPRAVWRPLPEGQDERQRQTPVRVINHTEVGSHEGTDSYFRRTDVGVESTFGIAGRYDGPVLDGEARQWVECDVIANANLEGDQDPADCVSLEHSDGTNPDHPDRWAEPLSAKQAETSWQVQAAVCWRYGIPPAALPDSCEGRTGIGWHRLGIKGNWTEPYPYSGWKPGCDVFSTATGKQCPGRARIQQLYYTGIPRIARILTSVRISTPAPPEEEDDDMQPRIVKITDPRDENLPYLYVTATGRFGAVRQEEASALGAVLGVTVETAGIGADQVSRAYNGVRRLAAAGADLSTEDIQQLAQALAAAMQPEPAPVAEGVRKVGGYSGTRDAVDVPPPASPGPAAE